ncbi:helix-turn-helix domain-containing protein [Burkholderia sp. 22PA0099]|uniref:helix-turn-helix domain-containing protein n=1 Tax=Burkholderia sp. 22PA0099 TaxID=3237372 RepID=UPI0039C43C48
MATVSPFYTWRRAMMCSGLPPTTKLVLFVVAEYTNGMDETCWPALETIAEKATLSIRAVTKHLKLASELGWLTRWKSRRPDRKWAHAHYRLSIPEAAALHQRDLIDLDLAASDAHADIQSSEPGAESAQEIVTLEPGASNSGGISAPGASNSGEGPEPDASNWAEALENVESVKSYWHHVPTNYPVNGSTNKPTLSQATVVRTGSGDQRGKSENSGRAFAVWMFEQLLARDPHFQRPDIDAWACDADAMVAVDRRTPGQMATLVGYALRDKFWPRVITSPARLRKNWDELRRRRNADIEASAKPPRAAGASAPAADDRQCAHVDENGCRCTNLAGTIIGAGSMRRGYCRAHVGKYSD